MTSSRTSEGSGSIENTLAINIMNIIGRPTSDTLKSMQYSTMTLEQAYPVVGSALGEEIPQIGEDPGGYPSQARILYWYHPDYIQNVDLITDLDGEAYELFLYNPWGEQLHHWSSNSSSWTSPYRFNAKEVDPETGLAYYGARYYQSKLGVWLSVDPMAVEMVAWSPFAFNFQNPITFIDPNGEKPTIYIEGTGLGHAFMTVGSGKNLVVYTYGRYLGGAKGKSVGGSTDPTGKGVIIKLTGKDAKAYLEHQLKDNNAQGFEINDISDENVAKYYEELMSRGTKLTESEARRYDENPNNFGSSDDARVLDVYDIFWNNCVTFCTRGAKAAGTKETFKQNSRPLDPSYNEMKVTRPLDIYLYLKNKVGLGSKNVTPVETNQ
jgi:RHS repeat-associated protein